MQPLANTCIVEIGNFIAAPFAAMLLGDLGAEVIKIERPGRGDEFRGTKGSYTASFRAYNRNKKSLSLDIRTPNGQSVLKRLVARADVLMENFRPGWLDKLGLGYEVLKQLNPRLVYCSITGFGPKGPYRARPSYDTVGQALSGLMSLYVDPLDLRFPGAAVSDNVTGLYACYAILGGLRIRDQSGRGLRVETNMLAATTAFTESWMVGYYVNREVPGIYRKSEATQSYVFRCADGKLIAVHLSTPPKFWAALITALGAGDLGRDPRFGTREGRVEHYGEVHHRLQALVERQPRSYWVQQFDAHDVPFAPVYTVDEVDQDPQVQALELFHDLQHPTGGPTRMSKRPVWYDGDSGAAQTLAPPMLGEHTEPVLAWLGYSGEEIQALRAKGAI